MIPFFFIFFFIFFFNDTATTEIYTLSLHDALPIWAQKPTAPNPSMALVGMDRHGLDRKSTRLNSSHLGISYAVFCLKKKNNKKTVAQPEKRYKKTRAHQQHTAAK